MSMYGKDEFTLVQQFAKRTRVNLEIIDKLRSRVLESEKLEAERGEGLELEFENVFEVTQLLNSCLGLLIFPYEKGSSVIRWPNLNRTAMKKQGWPYPRAVPGFDGREIVRYLPDMIWLIRNALAHCLLEFVPADKNGTEIGGLILERDKEGDAYQGWIAYFSIEDIRKLTDKIADEILGLRTVRTLVSR